MTGRTIEDQLREEYFELLSEAERIANVLETGIRYELLPIVSELEVYEKIVVHSRIKSCESAISSLKRRQEGNYFDENCGNEYTLTSLKDFVGVRVLAFPGRQVESIVRKLTSLYPSWESDPVKDAGVEVSYKFSGKCSISDRVRAEYQVTPMLIGLFWEVEHAAIYKASPDLKGAVASVEMQLSVRDVYKALTEFESQFQRTVG